jgi:5-methylthioribose kinase
MERKALYTIIDPQAPEELEAFLRELGWLEAGEVIRQVSRAGEGNMNCTLRLSTDQRTLIVKQSRPWVEKYPSIAAPEDRALVEAAFYQAVAPFTQIAERMPRLLGCDAQYYALLLEDLGETADFTFLYSDGGTELEPLPSLCQWLAALHGAAFSPQVRGRLENRRMRQLNHEHLYRFPLLVDNGLDLDRITLGLQEAAHRLKANAQYVRRVTELGELYLENGPCLLHGDFYPGSWVRSVDDVWVIDPEFCFFGPAEFDLGILIGHLLLARRPWELVDQALALYGPPAHFQRSLALRYAGMEIMRRLIGVAQLPLRADLATKEELLSTAERLVLEPEAF